MEVKKPNTEVKPISKQKLDELRLALTTMDWCEVSGRLLTLEVEYYKIKKHLNKRQDQLFRKLMKVYEFEKYRRIQEIEKNNPSSFYGPAEGSPAWLEDQSLLE